MDQLIATLDEYLVKKAPFQLPDSVKELLVKFGPWITLVLLVLLLPLLLVALGIGTIFVPFGGVGYAAGFGLTAIFALVQIALLVMALPGMFGRKKSAWMLMFYEQLVSLLGALLTGSIVGGIIGALIGLYFLFQLRTKYVN